MTLRNFEYNHEQENETICLKLDRWCTLLTCIALYRHARRISFRTRQFLSKPTFSRYATANETHLFVRGTSKRKLDGSIVTKSCLTSHANKREDENYFFNDAGKQIDQICPVRKFFYFTNWRVLLITWIIKKVGLEHALERERRDKTNNVHDDHRFQNSNASVVARGSRLFSFPFFFFS